MPQGKNISLLFFLRVRTLYSLYISLYSENTQILKKNRNTTDVGFNNQDNQNPKGKKDLLFLRLKNYILDYFERKPCKTREDGVLEKRRAK